MIKRLSGAAVRAILVALLIVTPALFVPSEVSDASQVVVLVALLAAVMVFVEYNSAYASFIEFRCAPPYNRVRFFGVVAAVLVLSLACRGKVEPTNLTSLMASVSTIIGNAADFPYSPVRLVTLVLPQDVDSELVRSVRSAAGTAYFISLIMMLVFVSLVRFLGWPTRNGAFNVWLNLPVFDPTAGGDVVQRLQRDARINLSLGFVLPFLTPAVAKSAETFVNPMVLSNPHTLIWVVVLWAFVPANLIMRGIALGRIAEMIEQKRKRAHLTDVDRIEVMQTA